MQITLIDPFPDEFIEALSQLPVQVRYEPQAQREQVLPWLKDTEVLILNRKIQVDREAIDAAPKLRRVIRAGVGMDHIDEDYLAQKGISAHNTAGANADAVAEQTVGMLLALRHHLHRADRQVRNFEWRREPNRGTELAGRKVGLIGYGHTGKAVARRLSGFRPQVLAYDKYLQGYGEIYAAPASLEQIFQQAEVVSLHVPLTEESHEMVNQDFLERFAQPIYLLNLARGPIVHLPSLLKA
ncbi:MAG: NAD(P)-dependent oxidoreductase, partial [Bacteroidota bacterium]